MEVFQILNEQYIFWMMTYHLFVVLIKQLSNQINKLELFGLFKDTDEKILQLIYCVIL